MRLSLWLKLMGILAIIIATGAIVTYILINRATTTQFRRFMLTGDIIQAETLAPLLADYYRQQGSWQGVETFITGAPMQIRMRGAMGSMGSGRMGSGTGQGHMAGNSPQQEGRRHDMANIMADRVILADTHGLVVADSQGQQQGRQYSSDQLAVGVPVVVDRRPVGTLLIGSMVEPDLNLLDQDFLRSVNLAVLVAALVVGVVALALGSFFFFHITAPVRDLTRAAEAVAGGDLSQQVSLRSQDEIGRLGQAFNTMTEAMKRTETLRRQMVADIAHDLRTPLSLIQGSLEAILDGMYELNLENVASIHEETLILTRLVNDLRELAQAEAGQLNLERQALTIDDLLSPIPELFRAQAAEQDVTLQTDWPAGLPAIYGDKQRLSQVLINLVANALRYTPPAGIITLSARSAADEPERLRQVIPDPASAPPTLLISVADTGQGIPVDDLAYVFERFYRADKSRTRVSGGAGLGLAIARQIVTAHDGHIWAESEPGKGSTFFFTAPIIGEGN